MTDMATATAEQAAGETTSPEVVVELSKVSKVYPNTTAPAVDGIDLAIRQGEFFSLLGSSGSGKTTTLRMIAGFERPSSGLLKLEGKDVTDVPPYRREVNTVFQNYALFPHMNVSKNVAYPLQMHGVPKKEIESRVADALEKVSMSDFAKRLPHQMSGGQKQRVALARALVGEPKLLLLDEPLGALDLKLRESMLLVLKHLQREVGITFVYVTHDQGEALAMSDRIAVMSNGRIEQIGSPEDIYYKPKTSFVARFIGKTNLLPCTKVDENTAATGDLKIRVTSTKNLEKFDLSVRPEDIRVVLSGVEGDNVFPAVVFESIFLGHEQELIVNLAGQRMSIRTRGLAVVPGDTVQLGWDAASSVVVRSS
ncbi:MAG TPA: ABC transporter ATP-binding protein [Rhodoglobus sp.]|nr:ABC transporter ATP-binding protein [Rhodoglobus sp.]